MRIVQALTLATLSLGSFAPASAIAQNLLANPEFTTSSAGWVPFGGGTVGWTGADGIPTPGALDFTHGGACDCEQFASQCIAVTPGARYQFRYATKRMVSGSPTYAIAYARVTWGENANCIQANLVIGGDGFTLDDIPVGVWQQRSGGSFTVPPTAVSMRVMLGAIYTGGFPILLRYDDVYLGPPPDAVFVDGFEG
jgi:hypothetical protein